MGLMSSKRLGLLPGPHAKLVFASGIFKSLNPIRDAKITRQNLLKALNAFLNFLSLDAVRVRWDRERRLFFTGASQAQIASPWRIWK
jgi:hypothetical protein